jgi:hypothetical protein
VESTAIAVRQRAPIKTSRFIEGGGEDEAGVFGEGYMGEVVFVAGEAGYRCCP